MPFPSSGGGGADPWENDAQVYVSTRGNNSNSGDSWQKPKKNIYNGFQRLASLGGGTIFIANGCAVGGPVAGQGIRLRSDNLAPSYYFDAQGFLPFGPTRVVGCGRGALNFAPGVRASITGGGTELSNPHFWIVGSGVMNPLYVNGLQAASRGALGYRIGVDYDRKFDGTVQWMNATASRTGAVTTFTVTLPTVGLTATSASRTSGTTTLTIPNPGLPWPPWRTGVPIRFAGATGFPAGDYVITGHSNALSNNATWTVSYLDAGLDAGPTVISSSVKTHGCRAGEILDLSSIDGNFRSAPYMVTGVTIDTITTTDNINTGDATSSNVGTVAHEERFYCGTTGVVVDTAAYGIDNTNVIGYHSFDIGHNASVRTIIKNSWYEGFVGNGSINRDDAVMSAIYCYAGTQPSYGPQAIGVKVWDNYGTNGSILADAGTGVCVIDARRDLHETNFVSLALPVLNVVGNGFTSVLGEDLENADADPDAPTCVVTGCFPSAVQITRSGVVSGPAMGADNFQKPGAWGSGSTTPTPWEGYGNGIHVVPWADGRISGKHPGTARTLGPVGARFKNIVAASGSWTLRGNTLTGSQADPFGGTNGVKVNSAGDYLSIFPNAADGSTWEAGGKFFVGGYFNFGDNETSVNDELFRLITTQVTFNESTTGSVPCPYAGPGWQYISGYLTVATVSTSTPSIELELRFIAAKHATVYGLTAFYVPASLSSSDSAEVVGTQVAQPRYLRPGSAGTFEGQWFIADGGVGPAQTISLGSANGKAIKIVNVDGTLAGYAELKDPA